MRARDLFPLALKAILTNKGRAALTMLGIVIGIASVMLMMSVGQSAEQYLLSQVASFGSDLVFISNGRGDETRGGPPSSNQKQTLTERDWRRLKALSWPRAVNANVISNDLLSYGGQERITSVVGAVPDEIVVFSMGMEKGRFLEQSDIDSASNVVVLGRKVANQFYGEEEPVGGSIKIGKRPYRVIGVLQPSGTRFFSDVDLQVYIPFTAAFRQYNKDRLNFVGVKTGDMSPHEAKELVRVELREAHNLDNPQGILSKDDFRVGTQEDAMRNADTIGTVLQVLLGSIAGISLFVAGFGIMNIMYVTVTERTREIGLRKSIGAKRRDILGQFLVEAILLTFVAGAIGVLSGITLSWTAIQVISHFQAGWSFVMPWNGMAIGFGVSAAIGIIFGYFPARKAAAMHPIEALRHE